MDSIRLWPCGFRCSVCLPFSACVQASSIFFLAGPARAIQGNGINTNGGAAVRS